MQEIYFQRFASNTYNLQLSQPPCYIVEVLDSFDNFAPAGIKSKNTVTFQSIYQNVSSILPAILRNNIMPLCL